MEGFGCWKVWREDRAAGMYVQPLKLNTITISNLPKIYQRF